MINGKKEKKIGRKKKENEKESNNSLNTFSNPNDKRE